MENYLNATHVLGESFVLFADLEGQLSGVAHNDDGDLSILRLKLLKCGQHKDGRLAHAGFGLAKDVHTENRLRNAFVLNWKTIG